MGSSEKKYKQYTVALLLITVAALLVCAAAWSFKRDAQATAGKVQAIPQQSLPAHYSSNTAASQETGSSDISGSSPESRAVQDGPYLITVHQGKIGVFRPRETSPFLLADVDVYLLPQEDLSLLKKGLRANSFSEVRQILEDYD